MRSTLSGRHLKSGRFREFLMGGGYGRVTGWFPKNVLLAPSRSFLPRFNGIRFCRNTFFSLKRANWATFSQNEGSHTVDVGNHENKGDLSLLRPLIGHFLVVFALAWHFCVLARTPQISQWQQEYGNHNYGKVALQGNTCHVIYKMFSNMRTMSEIAGDSAIFSILGL